MGRDVETGIVRFKVRRMVRSWRDGVCGGARSSREFVSVVDGEFRARGASWGRDKEEETTLEELSDRRRVVSGQRCVKCV